MWQKLLCLILRNYTTSHPNRIQEVIDTMESKVSVEMNQDLIKQFTKEEVEVALK